MNNFFLALENVSVNLSGEQILKNINLLIQPGEQWVITGPSGSGKTVLAHTLAGHHFFTGKINTVFGTPETFYRLVTVVEQQHRFRDITNRSDFYYQQRYNSADAVQTITVREELASYQPAVIAGGHTITTLLKLLKIDHLLQEPLIQLSNGENKRLQLVKALLQQPELLILDQPFIGLDKEGRNLLNVILDQLNAKGIKLLLITSPHEIPGYITHIATLDRGSLVATSSKKDYIPSSSQAAFWAPISKEQLQSIVRLPDNSFEFAVRMVNVNIQYEEKNILQDINWEVRTGEKWSVSGPNGAGKSTLLSLITGDNPQAYANEIYLFDRRRGSGESIWDIKKKIGYVSPEMHLYFDYSATCFHAIASGLFDTIGLFRQPDALQEELVARWIELLHIEKKQHKLLSQLATGEQRLILLARALIKNPPLLVLDEPCQGLDEEQAHYFKNLIDLVCTEFNTTLIYVSHYQQEIPDCVQRFLRLEKGILIVNE